ncbi:serine/threonine protein kinase [Streptomyces xanthii]|uniref:non-specific serine/threonine protein kinase n=1 Tax=Streptomyces xanthii TaxID=2768069 RepID=A0A7H1BK81_9ACTN|nr:serine/threonine protein kinase [Streptomyces xanthii]
MLDGLAASHDAGLIHRDIKPSNVMVTKDGVVKVLDFGIVRTAAADTSPVTRTGAVVGTAHCMSPEQAQGRELDHRSDLYSTGILLFELLCGRRPFDAGAEAALMYHHVHTQPPLLSDMGIAVPEAVQNLVSSALEKDPERRPATARQMRSLALAAAEVASPAHPPLVEQRPRIPDRRPTHPPFLPFPPRQQGQRLRRGGGLSRQASSPHPLATSQDGSPFHACQPLACREPASISSGWGCGLMYMPVLFGLLVGIRHVQATAPNRRRGLAIACISVNGLWAFYHLGTWLFGFPLIRPF